jgi:H+/Cl- antiporter ClcA
VQVGAALASSFAQALRFDKTDRRKLVICAISAGFASVFGAPIAGAIFGIESLFLGQLLYDVLFPSFVAGMVAYQVSLHFGVSYFTNSISIVPPFTGGLFFKVILAGVLFGLVSLVLIEAMKLATKLNDRIKLSLPLKGALAGAILLCMTLILGDHRYLGLGLNTIEGAALGQPVPYPAFLIKIIFTAVTLGSGASGGIITPIFFIGATSGSALGGIFGFDPGTFAAIGMVAVLAGAANTPISAGILAMELFGVKLGPWAATAAIVSYLMVGSRSIHSSQVVASLKSSSVLMPLNEKIGGSKTSLHVREKSLLGGVRRAYKKARKFMRNKAV